MSLKQVQNKIYSRKDVLHQVREWQQAGQKVVFTNGCFDLLHLGHISYLAEAATLGDKLVLGLNSDSSVKMLGKGANRPLQDENSRSLILASLQFIDAVVLFSEETPFELIHTLKPNVLVKGGDYQIEDIVGHQLVIANGGQVKTIRFVPGYSTSSLEQRMKDGES